jgi:hypothetical protein
LDPLAEGKGREDLVELRERDLAARKVVQHLVRVRIGLGWGWVGVGVGAGVWGLG